MLELLVGDDDGEQEEEEGGGSGGLYRLDREGCGNGN